MSYRRTKLTPTGASVYHQGAKEMLELMETSHFHLFMMPIVFVTTGYLFLFSVWGRRSKTVVISSCFAYIVLDISKPWLIRMAEIRLHPLAPINSGLLGITMLLCILVPIYEMWFLRAVLPTRAQV